MKGVLASIVLTCLISCCYSQVVTNLILDDFTNGANSQNIAITLSSDISVSEPPRVETNVFDAGAGCVGFIGCERGMSITVYEGLQGRVFYSEIFSSSSYFSGEWAVSCPKNSESEALIQYDGRDGSMDLDLNGLSNLDLTQGGTSNGFLFSAESDLDAQLFVNLHS